MSPNNPLVLPGAQKAPKDIGIDMIYVAKLLSDALGSKTPSYGAPVWLPEATQNSIKPQNNADKYHSDNSLSEVFAGTTGAQVATTLAGASQTTLALVCGHEPPMGKYVAGDFLQDSEPVAWGYRRMIHGKTADKRQKYRYVWLLKVIMMPPDEDSQTRAEKTTVSPTQFTGEAMPLDSFKPGNHFYRITMDNWEDGVTQADEDDFFKSVKWPGLSGTTPEPSVPEKPSEPEGEESGT